MSGEKSEYKKIRENLARYDLRNIGDSIKQLRILNKLTQEELSTSTGITRAHLSRLECHRYIPDLITLGVICRELNAKISITFDIQKIIEKNGINDRTTDVKLFGKRREGVKTEIEQYKTDVE